MGAIGLNPIRLDAIGLDPIRFNAIRLGVPGTSSATDRPYISPDVLSSLAGVWISDGKSNTDPDRNIIKNKLPGRGGDFELLNFAYTLNSGYGKYEEDFTQKPYWYPYKGVDATPNKLSLNSDFKPSEKWIIYKPKGNTLNDFKVRVSGIPSDGSLTFLMDGYSKSIHIANGDNDIKFDIPTTLGSSGFWIDKVGLSDWSNLVIEQISSFQGSLCTDGVNDMIVSQNPVSEMLDGSKELTVVSMIHQISPVPDSYGFTNYIREGSIWSRTNVKTSGKTGIYGYKISKGNTEVGASNLINNILGDKADYEAMGYNITNYSDINYSVAGYIKDGSPTEVSSVAWYWTFIAKRALTTDEINQVIAYYNLDKYVNPDIYYNVKKQGLTNDTPDEDWYLKDFSGNGRDMTLYNYARTPESGINEEGGLQSDGVDDYGQFVGDLGLKDYTVAVDRAYVQLLAYQVPLISEIKSNGITPFIFEYVDSNKVNPFSFGDSSKTNDIVLNRKVSYQSTYVYNGLNITKGTATDTGKGITIGRYGDDRQYANIVLWSFLLFPYTLSEFLLERQLKKHKLGTLYPGMVEFRPIVKSNIPYSSISYSANPGEYVIEGSTVTITITLSNSSDKLVDISSNAISDMSISGDNGVYEVTGKVTKSPQKINIVISSYLTMLDNETLITNETLIKNE